MYKHILPVSKRAAAIFNSLRFISLIIGLTIGNALFAQATLTLHTNITPGSSSSLDYLGGHAWATLTEGGVTTSYGTWGNNAIDPVTGLTHNGLFVDLELHLGMESSVTRSVQLDANQLANFKAVVAKYEHLGDNGWSGTNNCSGFAVEVWNAAATSENQLSNGSFLGTPFILQTNMQTANGGATSSSGPVANAPVPTHIENQANNGGGYYEIVSIHYDTYTWDGTTLSYTGHTLIYSIWHANPGDGNNDGYH
jgi:hypothetical protein